jgi:hypothetical protein
MAPAGFSEGWLRWGINNTFEEINNDIYHTYTTDFKGYV